MSKKMNQEVDFSKVAAKVIKTPLQNFVEDSYLPYAHYVISSRALISDDGLKPVQRRILYAMNQLGLDDKKDHIKAAQISGETMGKYHPHGDSSINSALARMGQTFAMRVPLVDVQGSVGTVTGDEPAAVRYWEGRPTAAAMELLKELKDGAVEMGVNYDGKFPEPQILPIRWPNGLVNGSQGIAVGYSSTIPPHNPGEVMDAAIELAKNPDLDTEGILKVMPGPDMPTGGTLVGYEGVKEYYETGRGTFKVRGRYKVEPGNRGTHIITFYESPYQVSAEQLIMTIDKQKKDNNRFKEISYVKDLSGFTTKGFNFTIGVKAGANPDLVIKDLFKYTQLEQSFPVNLTILVGGAPKVSTVKEILTSFIEFRTECILNKSRNKLDVIDKKIAQLSGIDKVLVDIDKAIEIIRKSENSEIANNDLQKTFKVTEEQSNYILSMPLRRLTKADSLSLRKEIEELTEERHLLNAIMTDDEAFTAYLIEELEATKKVINDERRTIINNKTQEELKAEEAAMKRAAARDAKNSECYVTLFSDGSITKTEGPYEQERSPIGITAQVKTRTQEKIILVLKDGEAMKVPVSHISEDVILDVKTATGIPSDSIVGLGVDKLDKGDIGLLVVSSDGGVNIVNKFPNSDKFTLTKLKEDTLKFATWIDKKAHNELLVLVSSDGYITSFPIEQIRTSNSGAGTVKGMNVDEGAKIVGAAVATEETAEVVSCTHETIKVTKLSEIPSRNRGAKGVILQRLSEHDEILNAFAGDRVIANKSGKSLRLPEANERALMGAKRSGTNIKLGNY